MSILLTLRCQLQIGDLWNVQTRVEYRSKWLDYARDLFVVWVTDQLKVVFQLSGCMY